MAPNFHVRWNHLSRFLPARLRTALLLPRSSAMKHRLTNHCIHKLAFILPRGIFFLDPSIVHHTMHHLLLPAVLLLFAAADAYTYTESCSNATCGGQSITYPFWLANSGPNCGYPGLGITCKENTPIMDVQFHRYRVLRIDYADRTVSLADADAWNTTCPRLSFNLSPDPNSWLQLTASNSKLTLLYNCKASVPRPSAVKLDGCPEQKNTWFVLPDDGVTGRAYGHGCEEAVTTPVRHSLQRLANSPALGEVLSRGFEMRYDAKSEQCGACEQSGGRCRYGRIEEHGGTEFACLCNDGANERQCDRITSTSSLVLICLLVFACLLGCRKYCSAHWASHPPCSFHEPIEVSLSLLAGHAGYGSSSTDARFPRHEANVPQ